MESTCEGDCSFTYYKQEESPVLHSISTNSITSGMGQITLEGERLDYNFSGEPSVSLRNTDSLKVYTVEALSYSNTTIVFNVPNIPSGKYEVRIRLDEYGETNAKSLTINSRFSPGAYSFSTEGGLITLTGNGFPE